MKKLFQVLFEHPSRVLISLLASNVQYYFINQSRRRHGYTRVVSRNSGVILSDIFGQIQKYMFEHFQFLLCHE